MFLSSFRGSWGGSSSKSLLQLLQDSLVAPGSKAISQGWPASSLVHNCIRPYFVFFCLLSFLTISKLREGQVEVLSCFCRPHARKTRLHTSSLFQARWLAVLLYKVEALPDYAGTYFPPASLNFSPKMLRTAFQKTRTQSPRKSQADTFFWFCPKSCFLFRFLFSFPYLFQEAVLPAIHAKPLLPPHL